MKLQYSAQISTGTTWIDCQDRYEEFLNLAAKHHGHTVAQVTNNGLLKGMSVSIGEGWDAKKIRDADSQEKTEAELRKEAEAILRKSRAADGYECEEDF